MKTKGKVEPIHPWPEVPPSSKWESVLEILLDRIVTSLRKDEASTDIEAKGYISMLRDFTEAFNYMYPAFVVKPEAGGGPFRI